MKKLLDFYLLHLAAMVIAYILGYILGGFFFGQIFCNFIATDMVVRGAHNSIWVAIGSDYTIWESFLQLLIFIAFSYSFNSKLKIVTNWSWGIMTLLSVIIFLVIVSCGKFDFGISKTFPPLRYQAPAISRMLLFVGLQLVIIGGYLLNRMFSKIE